MSCGVGCRRSSDPTLLWLCCRLAATALIRPLAWEPPYAAGVALEKMKRQKKEKKKEMNHLGVYNFVALRIVTVLHNRQLPLLPNIFISPKGSPEPTEPQWEHCPSSPHLLSPTLSP